MARWMGLAADWLRPIYEKIRTGVMAGGYLQIDETPIRYLSPGHGQTKLGYFWTALSPGGDVVYHWETSRGADCLKNVIAADFQGTLQCDAYVAYGSFVKKHERNITLAGCWAHGRRNFYEAREQAPQRCGWILRQIGHLYRIEDTLRRSQAGPRKRAAVRMSQSRPICQRLHRALVLFKKSRRYLPRSAFGQAIDYALSNWPLLGVYLQDGRIEIDNNLVENSIRPTALGKKNWLFFNDADAGQRSAILYTIIESCRCRGIDPHAYLRDVLTRLPSMTNWKLSTLLLRPGRKLPAALQRQPLHSPIITVIAPGYHIYVANIKSMSIGARRDAYVSVAAKVFSFRLRNPRRPWPRGAQNTIERERPVDFMNNLFILYLGLLKAVSRLGFI
jgi:hypothetical protein